MGNPEQQRDTKMLAIGRYFAYNCSRKAESLGWAFRRGKSGKFYREALQVKSVEDLHVLSMNRKEMGNELSQDLEEMANLNKTQIRVWKGFDDSAEYEERKLLRLLKSLPFDVLIIFLSRERQKH